MIIQLSFWQFSWKFSQERPASPSVCQLLYSWQCQTSISMILTILVIDNDGKNSSVFRKVLWFIQWIPIHYIFVINLHKRQANDSRPMWEDLCVCFMTLENFPGVCFVCASWKRTWSLTFPWEAENQRIDAKIREAILILTLLGDPGKDIFICKIFFSCDNENNNNTYFMEFLRE